MARDDDLLGILVAEVHRRTEAIIDGVEELAGSGRADPDRIEALRGEAHGLEGAAAVAGQSHLAELARAIELTLIDHRDQGTIEVELAALIVTAASALLEGSQAAAEGVGEPASVARSLAGLSR